TDWLAAVWWCGGDTTLSHFSAGAFLGHGDEPDPRVVHVTTTRAIASRPGVEVHRTRHLHRLDWSRHGLLPVTNRSRTLIDEASLLAFPTFRARAERLKALPLAELRAALVRAPGRPGSTAVRRLLAGEDAHARSVLERRYLRFCRHHGVPRPPELNVWVAGHLADGVHRRERLVIELDGRAHHERRAQMRADNRRDADYQLAGYRILRLTWWDLEAEWAAQTARLVTAFLGLTND
ncbi:MAG: endonuclease domain-containing protein, partial [Actinomycetota bacterium]|nr:endonuclease domain-containing protein [Actinomycetota bacterium]